MIINQSTRLITSVRTAHRPNIKELLGMLARIPWGRGDMLGSMNGKHEGVSVKYASLIVSCHWIKVFITK